MKRFITTIALIFGVVSLVSADERPIESSKLPKAALEFVNSNFADTQIVFSTVDREVMGTDYEVRLADGTKIEFDSRGAWTDVSNKRTGLPYSVLPLPIADHLKANYPTEKYIGVEHNRHSYEVKLSNGLELVFSLDGKLIGYDD